MYTRTTVIINESGLHARPASDFIKTANRFTSKISIRKTDSGDACNAKSIVFLLAMGLARGMEVEISAEGADEAQAVDALIELIESGCGE